MLKQNPEHDPEKCEAVFPRDKRNAFARRSCSIKNVERDDPVARQARRSSSQCFFATGNHFLSFAGLGPFCAADWANFVNNCSNLTFRTRSGSIDRGLSSLFTDL